jgi:hypothetical protein
VAKGNASIFSIHQMMAVFGQDDRFQVRALIDGHLTDQIDYRLVDYHAASPSYLKLMAAVDALNPGTSQEEVVYKEMVQLGVDMGEYRALIERRPVMPCQQSSGAGYSSYSSCSSH